MKKVANSYVNDIENYSYENKKLAEQFEGWKKKYDKFEDSNFFKNKLKDITYFNKY